MEILYLVQNSKRSQIHFQMLHIISCHNRVERDVRCGCFWRTTNSKLVLPVKVWRDKPQTRGSSLNLIPFSFFFFNSTQRRLAESPLRFAVRRQIQGWLWKKSPLRSHKIDLSHYETWKWQKNLCHRIWLRHNSGGSVHQRKWMHFQH